MRIFMEASISYPGGEGIRSEGSGTRKLEIGLMLPYLAECRTAHGRWTWWVLSCCRVERLRWQEKGKQPVRTLYGGCLVL